MRLVTSNALSLLLAGSQVQVPIVTMYSSGCTSFPLSSAYLMLLASLPHALLERSP